jgi:hypothetical protein
LARFTYAVLSRAKPGQEAEFKDWYCRQHLPDVLKMPGVVSGRLVDLGFQRVYDLDAARYCLLTIYELEGDDPEAIVNALRDASGSAAMPASEALDKAGMIQVAGTVIAEG